MYFETAVPLKKPHKWRAIALLQRKMYSHIKLHFKQNGSLLNKQEPEDIYCGIPNGYIFFGGEGAGGIVDRPIMARGLLLANDC